MDGVVVQQVAAATTFPLRQQVLRPHQSVADMALAGDDDPRSGHFAASFDGRVVGTASVRPEPPPWTSEHEPAWRLRGMATAPPFRSQGVGAALLGAVLRHVVGHGGGLVWCNARTPATAFYARHGFALRGEPWEDPDIGPHVQMWRTVTAPEGTAPPSPAAPEPDDRAEPRATTPPR